MFAIEFENFDWLLVVSQSKKINFKISQFLRFLLRYGYAILAQLSKWLELLNFVTFIKKTQFAIEFDLYDWLLVVLQSKKIIFKISQFSWFLLRFGSAILVKILKWPKLLNFVKFIKKTRVNHVYYRIWSFWLTFSGFTVKEEKLQN